MFTFLTLMLIAADPEPKKMEWKVDGVARDALVHLPAKPSGAPVIFAWHGHGGTSKSAVASFHFHAVWPEAVVVYPQGLNTPSRTDPKGEKPGWQGLNAQGDRDLKFFDAMLDTLKKDHKIDEKRIYTTGHSNGGGFTYLLWAARGEFFAAFAPSAASSGTRIIANAPPRPVLHLAGEKDTVVPFDNQKECIEAIKKHNGCEESGKDWAKGCTLFPSKDGTPVVTFIHPGDHKYPTEGPELIVKFFKEHAKK